MKNDLVNENLYNKVSFAIEVFKFIYKTHLLTLESVFKILENLTKMNTEYNIQKPSDFLNLPILQHKKKCYI